MVLCTVPYKQTGMEEYSFDAGEDFLFQDIFEDVEAETHQDSEESLNYNSPSTSSTVASQSKGKYKKHVLNKKEKESVIKSLKACDSEQLLHVVVDQLSTELHMTYYPEREELMICLLDSSEDEIKVVCSTLATSFIELYQKCSKGEGKVCQVSGRVAQSLLIIFARNARLINTVVVIND